MSKTHPRVLAVVDDALRQIDLVEGGGERLDSLHDVPRNHEEHAQVEQKQQSFDAEADLDEGGKGHHSTSGARALMPFEVRELPAAATFVSGDQINAFRGLQISYISPKLSRC